MILVTGATGQIGGAVLAQLPGGRALVRRPTDLENAVVGDFDDERSLRAALEGIDTLFLIGRDNPDQVAQHTRVLSAAQDVRHVVKLSAIGARADSPVALMRWHHAIEQQLERFRWTFLRPHLFMQNLLRFAGDVAGRGTIAAPMGDRAYPLVDTRDVAAAAAAVLRDPEPHAHRIYTLTGPAAVTYDQVAKALGARYEPQSPDAFRAALLDAGIPEWRADDLANIAAAYTDEENEPTGDLPGLLGRPATSLERFLEDHRDRYASGVSRSFL